MYKYLGRKGGRVGLLSGAQCQNKEQQAQMETQEISFKQKRKSVIVKEVGCWNRLVREVVIIHALSFFKHDLTWA